MRHDTSIPNGFHDGEAASVKDALGAFWSSVFKDQDLVDALLAARVLSAGQLHVDVMEALSLRDHAGSPVLHREHWHPFLVRLSKRNTASVMVVGMPDTPVVGAQPEDGAVYCPNEVFVVGGNALYSKVNTYPIEGLGGCPLVRVATAVCDSISAPRHILSQGRDFALERGVLAVRKEQDPFDVDGYRVIEDGDDRVAVLWACDAEFDRDNVSDFLGYPLGLHAPSTCAASKMLSALWDAVTLGLTPISLNKVLGAVYGVPVVAKDTVVEAVTEDGDDSLVVTGDRVYRIEASRLAGAVVPGAVLKAGSFLTDEVTVYWGLSADDVAQLRAEARLGRVALPPGSVAGVGGTVVIEPGARMLEPGGWFKLSDGDSADSPFWQAVFARTTEAERVALFSPMILGGTALVRQSGSTAAFDIDNLEDGDYACDVTLTPDKGEPVSVTVPFSVGGSGAGSGPASAASWTTAEMGVSEWSPLQGNLLAGAAGTTTGYISGYGGPVSMLTNGTVSGDTRQTCGFGENATVTWEFDGPKVLEKLRITTCYTANYGIYDDMKIAKVEVRSYGSNEWKSVCGAFSYTGTDAAGLAFTATLEDTEAGFIVENATALRIAFAKPTNVAQYYAEIEAVGVDGPSTVIGSASAAVAGSTATIRLSDIVLDSGAGATSYDVSYSLGVVNPVTALGPVVLANLILVYTTRVPVDDMCSALVLDYLRRLVPAYASLLVVQSVGADDTGEDAAMTMSDETVHGLARSSSDSEQMGGMSDDVVFTFAPSAATEV